MIHCPDGAGEIRMLGRKNRDRPELFVTGSLRQLLPDDHVLVRVDRALELELQEPRL